MGGIGGIVVAKEQLLTILRGKKPKVYMVVYSTTWTRMVVSVVPVPVPEST